MGPKTAPRLAIDEQAAIVRCDARRILVEANAGVGKTTTLCLRALRWVEQGADPARILLFTYSQPGQLAIRRTLRKLGAPAALTQALRIGTFEEFCSARLRRLENTEPARPRRREEVKAHVLAAIEAARNTAEHRFPGAFSLQGTGELAVEALLDAFDRIKGSLVLRRQDDTFRLTPDSAPELGFDYTSLAVFQAYERIRRVEIGPDGEQTRFRYPGDATYDLACALLAADPVFTDTSHPLRLGELHGLGVDEFHDMNRAMATVLSALMGRYPELAFLGVGDVDQVIHADNGAQSYFLREGFDIEFGPAQRLPLTQTLRFGPAISRLLGNFSRKRYSSQAGCRSEVRCRPLGEALELALHIERLLKTRRLERAKSSHGEVAVLLRHPHAALDLEYELLNRGLFYQAVGFTPYMSRPEVLFVRMLLSAAIGYEDAFTPASLRLAKQASWEFIGGDLPLDGLGDPDTGAKIEQAPVAHFQSFMLEHLLSRTPRQPGARRIRAALASAHGGGIADLRNALAGLRMPDLARQVFVDAEAVRDANDSCTGLERMLGRGDFTSIEELLRIIRNQEQQMDASGARERLVMSTIAQAKGLEFEHVIIPGLDRGEFDAGDEDERHLFYVALSRARLTLELFHAADRRSRYLDLALGDGPAGLAGL